MGIGTEETANHGYNHEGCTSVFDGYEDAYHRYGENRSGDGLLWERFVLPGNVGRGDLRCGLPFFG